MKEQKQQQQQGGQKSRNKQQQQQQGGQPEEFQQIQGESREQDHFDEQAELHKKLRQMRE